MATNPLSIESINVRGIRDNKKRNNVFQWLKKRNTDIFFISETHCHHKKDKSNWGKEWSNDKNDSIWSLGTNRSKGVAVLFNPKFRSRDISYTDVISDPNGRFIKFMLTICGIKYRILNIYAPNNGKERVNFFVSLHDILNDDHDAETIVGVTSIAP